MKGTSNTMIVRAKSLIELLCSLRYKGSVQFAVLAYKITINRAIAHNHECQFANASIVFSTNVPHLGRPEILHMTQVSLVALHEIDLPDATMTLAMRIHTEAALCEAERDVDRYQIQDQIKMPFSQTETTSEIQ